MSKIVRVIYPFMVYMIIAEVAVSVLSELLPENGLYQMALAAAVTCGILWPFYRRDQVMRGKLQTGDAAKSGWMKGLGFALLLGAALCVAGNNLITLIRLDELFPSYNEEVAKELFTGSLPAQLLCVGLAIPAAEEMVFRILGFRRLRDYMGFVPAALITSFLFGLYHGNVVQGVYAFLLAIFIACAYERYDRAFVPMGVHASANILSVIFTAFGDPWSNGMVPMLIETVLAVGLIIWSLKKIRFYGLTNQ